MTGDLPPSQGRRAGSADRLARATRHATPGRRGGPEPPRRRADLISPRRGPPAGGGNFSPPAARPVEPTRPPRRGWTSGPAGPIVLSTRPARSTGETRPRSARSPARRASAAVDEVLDGGLGLGQARPGLLPVGFDRLDLLRRVARQLLDAFGH